MRVGFLVWNELIFDNSFRPLSKVLDERGHETRAFFDKPWWNFDFSEIDAFSPDLLVVFNGQFDWQFAAVRVLESRYKICYAENGWLPQAGNIYLDHKGAGSRSTVFSEKLGYDNQDLDLSSYTEGEYILVPLQLPMDTSILYDSPVFKTMETFTNFVRSALPDERILVKPHPKDPMIKEISGVEYANPEQPITELFSSAKAVVGINSTSLIEALQFHKPVASFGYNMAWNKGVFLEFPFDLGVVLKYHSDTARVNKCLDYLKTKQFQWHNPPAEAVDFLLGRGPE